LYENFENLQIGGYHQVTADEVVRSFRATLTSLINQPGNMEELMRGVIDMIFQLPESQESILDAVVDMLFEQVILIVLYESV
jgi:AcrR family transcriptional regulator